MYLFKVDKLVYDLIENKISEKEKFGYLLIALLINAMILSFLGFGSDINNHYDNLQMVINFGFLILGTIMCFKINAKYDNKFFVERYVSLAVPIAVRAALYTSIIYFILIIFTSVTTKVNIYETSGTSMYDIMAQIMYNIFFYVNIFEAINKVASGKK